MQMHCILILCVVYIATSILLSVEFIYEYVAM